MELCDGADNDCDGSVDNEAADATSWYADADGDSFGGAFDSDACAAPAGTVSDDSDCDDGDSAVNFLATETCDGVDEDCDGETDDGLPLTLWYTDTDGDNYGDSTAEIDACAAPAGTIGLAGDCNDADAAVNPGVPELCDGIEQDCDAVPDDGLTLTMWYTDADGDGYGGSGVAACAARRDDRGWHRLRRCRQQRPPRRLGDHRQR